MPYDWTGVIYFPELDSYHPVIRIPRKQFGPDNDLNYEWYELSQPARRMAAPTRKRIGFFIGVSILHPVPGIIDASPVSALTKAGVVGCTRIAEDTSLKRHVNALGLGGLVGVLIPFKCVVC